MRKRERRYEFGRKREREDKSLEDRERGIHMREKREIEK